MTSTSHLLVCLSYACQSPCTTSFLSSFPLTAAPPSRIPNAAARPLAGWGGPNCADPVKRPCAKDYRKPRNSTVPSSHIGPDKRDLDWLAKGSTYSRSANGLGFRVRVPGVGVQGSGSRGLGFRDQGPGGWGLGLVATVLPRRTTLRLC